MRLQKWQNLSIKLTPIVHKRDEAVYVSTSCTRPYLRPVELQLCLALGFTPIRLAVLLCWQVWIRRSTGVGISRALSGESGRRRTAGTPFPVINHLISSCSHTNTTQVMRDQLRPTLICLFLCWASAVLRELTQIYNTMLCSPTPAMFSETKYSTKGATASSSLLLGPNPSLQPPQCSTYTSLFAVYSPRTSPH